MIFAESHLGGHWEAATPEGVAAYVSKNLVWTTILGQRASFTFIEHVPVFRVVGKSKTTGENREVFLHASRLAWRRICDHFGLPRTLLNKQWKIDWAAAEDAITEMMTYCLNGYQPLQILKPRTRTYLLREMDETDHYIIREVVDQNWSLPHDETGVYERTSELPGCNIELMRLSDYGSTFRLEIADEDYKKMDTVWSFTRKQLYFQPIWDYNNMVMRCEFNTRHSCWNLGSHFVETFNEAAHELLNQQEPGCYASHLNEKVEPELLLTEFARAAKIRRLPPDTRNTLAARILDEGCRTRLALGKTITQVGRLLHPETSNRIERINWTLATESLETKVTDDREAKAWVTEATHSSPAGERPPRTKQLGLLSPDHHHEDQTTEPHPPQEPQTPEAP